MTDIDIDISKLSIPARHTMALLNEYIDRMNDGTIILKTKELQLYYERWDELNGSISYQSGRDYNLKDFTYRGIQIVPWDGV